MKITITNKTHWNTSHLREFIKRGIRQERVDLCKRGALPMRVTVKYNRGGDRHQSCSGYAVYHSNWMKLMLPSGGVDRVDFAHTIMHELAHTGGINHRQMEGCATYSRVGNWRELYAWAETMPLEKVVVPVRIRPTVDAKIDHSQKMLRRAITREKRARTIRKRWESRLRRLERLTLQVQEVAA